MGHAGPSNFSKVHSANSLEIDSGLGLLAPSSFLALRHRQTRGCLRSTAQPIHVAGLPVIKDSVLLLHG